MRLTDEQIRDRIAIEEVLHAYCRTLDEMDLDALVKLFTGDCVVEYGPGELMRSNGASRLRSDLERMWRYRRTSHHLSNVEVRFEPDDRATAHSYVFAWHERADGTMGTLYGQYRDTLVRIAGEWRIQRRRLLMTGNDAGFTAGIHRLERRPPPTGWTPPDASRL